MTLTLCVPTRGRPDRFAAMWASAQETAHADIECSAVLDDDDPTLELYPTGEGIIQTVVPGEPVGTRLWNVAQEHGTGDIFMLAADDIMFRTPGWDVAVRKELEEWPGRIGMVYCDDLHPVNWQPPVIPGWDPAPGVQTKQIARKGYSVWARADRPGGFNFPTHPFVTREWVEAAGWFVPPYFFPTWEGDQWLLLLAEGVGRIRYLSEYVIEHLHPMVKGPDGKPKAELDESYKLGSWHNRPLWDAAKRISHSEAMQRHRAKQIDALKRAAR